MIEKEVSFFSSLKEKTFRIDYRAMVKKKKFSFFFKDCDTNNLKHQIVQQSKNCTFSLFSFCFSSSPLSVSPIPCFFLPHFVLFSHLFFFCFFGLKLLSFCSLLSLPFPVLILRNKCLSFFEIFVGFAFSSDCNAHVIIVLEVFFGSSST